MSQFWNTNTGVEVSKGEKDKLNRAKEQVEGREAAHSQVSDLLQNQASQVANIIDERLNEMVDHKLGDLELSVSHAKHDIATSKLI
jgi:hypothetical protein